MRRDRPAKPQQTGIASGLGPGSSLQLASAARHAFRLTNGRPRSSFSGANRPIWRIRVSWQPALGRVPIAPL
jgi:hypothetical protein